MQFVIAHVVIAHGHHRSQEGALRRGVDVVVGTLDNYTILFVSINFTSVQCLQEGALRRGVDVVVGTPGRIKDLMARNSLKLNAIR